MPRSTRTSFVAHQAPYVPPSPYKVFNNKVVKLNIAANDRDTVPFYSRHAAEVTAVPPFATTKYLARKQYAEFSRRPDFGLLTDDEKTKVDVKLFLARADSSIVAKKLIIPALTGFFSTRLRKEYFFHACIYQHSIRDDDAEIVFFFGSKTRPILDVLRAALSIVCTGFGHIERIFQTLQPINSYTGARDRSLDHTEQFHLAVRKQEIPNYFWERCV